MEFLGLHYAIWVVMALYFAGMLLLGWWSKHGIQDRNGFLMGKRQFGVPMMVMHAFGAGTHPGDVAGVTSKTVERGASGIWVSWMWMAATPIYWLIAPVVRRMRCLTLADYFEERFGHAAAILYVIVATVGMTVAAAGVLLATTRTVQGMMGKALRGNVEGPALTSAQSAPASAPLPAAPGRPPDASTQAAPWEARGVATRREADAWFFGILIVTTAVFVVYSYWGGIIAAIRTDFAQGLMIIALSFLAIPAAMALPEVGGWSGAKATVATRGGSYLSLFDPGFFSLAAVLALLVNAPFSILAQPHLMTVCGAGRTEWEGRVGFTYGNILKRVCTMGWGILAICWLAFLVRKGSTVHPDAAFGDSVRYLLHPILQGVMLACVLAAAMSTGDALQVTIAGLFTQSIYRRHVRRDADEAQCLRVTRLVGLGIMAAAVAFAVIMRASIVRAILEYFNLTATVGISVAMGILWRRMNSVGVFASTLAAAGTFLVAKYALNWGQAAVTAYPIFAGVLFGIVGSMIGEACGAATRPEVIETFFKKIYVPIGQEEKLDLPLDQAVPPNRRLLTAGGLFLVKPSRQSWVGFVVTLAICLAMVGLMLLLLM